MFKKKNKVTKYWLDKLECEYDLHVIKLDVYFIPYKLIHQGCYGGEWYERKYYYDNNSKSVKAFTSLPEIVEWAEKNKNKENK